MSKINDIQKAILSLGAGAYQKMMDAYLYRKYGFDNIMSFMPLGSHSGTDKTTRGVPDSHVMCNNGKFILISHGTVETNAFSKVKADIQACLEAEKTGINVNSIERIICCHTSTNFTPGQIKELCSLFADVVLVGLADVSYDLLYKYQAIALDHLHIHIDTHQIFTVDEYIAEASKNAYSTTLDMPILCRESELNNLADNLSKEQVVLIFGASGIGKTRLAIEAARQYAQKNNAVIKVIRSNNESIYNDLVTAFSNEENYIVVVDDANQLAEIGHLFSMAADPNRKGKIKLVLTVRDYAKDVLRKRVREYFSPVEYALSALSDDSIEKILSDNLNIKNDDAIKQICRIAKGNARLAVMAGMCVKEGKYDQIRNAFDIFNDYYSLIIDDMEKNELFVASLVALFDNFVLDKSTIPFEIAVTKGVSEGEFVERCYSLHKKEVVSIFDKRAVRFENQNLRDYLIYYVFFKAKIIEPSEVIVSAFPRHREKIIFAFNTLLQLFNSAENIKYIEEEIKKAWRVIRGSSEDIIEKFVESFLVVIPDEAMAYIKRKIDNAPYVQNNLSAYNFKKSDHQHVTHSKLIDMLEIFKQTEQFKDAIQLAILYFEKNNENPMDFYFLFSEKWGYDTRSHKENYKEEGVLVETVLDNYMQKRTLSAALCLYFVVSNCLKFTLSTTEAKNNKSFSFIRFGLLACESLYEIRERCVFAIGELLSVPEYSKYAYIILKDMFANLGEGNCHDILAHDINALEKYVSQMLCSKSFRDCIVLNHLEETCLDNDTPYPASFDRCSNNQVYSLYQVMNTNFYYKYKDYDLGEEEHRKVLVSLCEQTPISCYLELWVELSKLVERGETLSWEIGQSIEMVFDFLKSDKDAFMECLKGYLQQNLPGCNLYYPIIDNLIELQGWQESEKMVSNIEFRWQPQWLARIYDNIPADEMDEAFERKVLAIKEKPKGDRYPIAFETAMKVNNVRKGFIVDYIKTLNEIGEEQPWIVGQFLFPLTSEDEESILDFLYQFAGCMDVIFSAYLLAIMGHTIFDYKGKLLSKLLDEDIYFVDKIIKTITKDGSPNKYNCLVNNLWNHNRHMECITIAFDQILKQTFPSRWLLKMLIDDDDKNEAVNGKRQTWIESCISENANDIERMQLLFEVVCNCTYAQFLQALICFCKYNQDYDAFCKLPLSPTFFSWTGSEVPLIEKQIEFLEELKDGLKGFQFIEHRERISGCIFNAQERKQRVLMEEFLARE